VQRRKIVKGDAIMVEAVTIPPAQLLETAQKIPPHKI
jgi:hypothetical protein